MDIDIDFKTRNDLISILDPALALNTDYTNHNVGVYFQHIPRNPITKRASFNFDEAAVLGYTKFDLLNLTMYDNVTSEQHLQRLVDHPAPWELLTNTKIVSNLFHLHSPFITEICVNMAPQSIEELAIVLAIVRPGKQHLIGKPNHEIHRDIWKKTDKYYFKKAHAYSYAQVVIIQMNMLIGIE